jgi:hypothetical protein
LVASQSRVLSKIGRSIGRISIYSSISRLGRSSGPCRHRAPGPRKRGARIVRCNRPAPLSHSQLLSRFARTLDLHGSRVQRTDRQRAIGHLRPHVQSTARRVWMRRPGPGVLHLSELRRGVWSRICGRYRHAQRTMV